MISGIAEHAGPFTVTVTLRDQKIRIPRPARDAEPGRGAADAHDLLTLSTLVDRHGELGRSRGLGLSERLSIMERMDRDRLKGGLAHHGVGHLHVEGILECQHHVDGGVRA